MLTFLVAHLVVWLGVLGYVFRLAVHERRLKRALGVQAATKTPRDAGTDAKRWSAGLSPIPRP